MIYLPRLRFFAVAASVLLALAVSVPGESRAGPGKNSEAGKVTFKVGRQGDAARKNADKVYPSRYRRPNFLGKSLPRKIYKGFTLLGADQAEAGSLDNASFFGKIVQSIDLIERKTPKIYRLMRDINPDGRRVIAYSGGSGPASFTAWENDFIVDITATDITDDPVFDNSVYSLSATLVHELVGHGRQQIDGRVWAMYDWCGQSNGKIEGVAWATNQAGHSSGLIEYEANLFARWFLESVRGAYPVFNEALAHPEKALSRLV